MRMRLAILLNNHAWKQNNCNTPNMLELWLYYDGNILFFSRYFHYYWKNVIYICQFLWPQVFSGFTLPIIRAPPSDTTWFLPDYCTLNSSDIKSNSVVPSDTTQVMAIVADFMLVYLPAPTVSLQPPLARNAGAIANFFHNCPDNAFQVKYLFPFSYNWIDFIIPMYSKTCYATLLQIALAGRSFSLLQRLGAILVK